MRVPILTYQPMYIHGNGYRDNHLAALAEDLRQLTRAGFRIAPLRSVVDAWLGGRVSELEGRVVALASDDGADFDYRDLTHPTAGPQKSLVRMLREFATENPGAQAALNVTSFVIVSPDARRALDAACMIGAGWWGDEWWAEAAATGLLHIASHSWDHNHAALPPDLSPIARRGTFSAVCNEAFADHEIRQAAEYLRRRAPNPGTALFAYPYGESNRYLTHEYLPEHAEALGIEAAFTARPGFLEMGCGRWEIPRFVCGRDWSSPSELSDILDAATKSSRRWVAPLRHWPMPQPVPEIESDGLQRFADFIASSVEPIPGWLHPEAALLTAHLASVQRALGMNGPTLEIGLYQGKYLAVLYDLAAADEVVVGVDLFVGADDLEAAERLVRSNVAAACGESDRLRIVVGDTLRMEGERLAAESGGRPFRFVSIDGGHTCEVVQHDLELAYPLLARGGIIALDDAFNYGTPGVIEGIARFFLDREPELAPFAQCFNKLFVTTPEFHARYLEAAVEFIDRVPWLRTARATRARRDENRVSGFTPSLFGHEIVSFE